MAVSLGLTVSMAQADLQAIPDEALGDFVGQAIFKVQDFKAYPQSGGGSLDFTRMTVGAKVEINANIALLELGRYPRATINDSRYNTGAVHDNNKAYCREGGRFCSSNDGWACANNPCGWDSNGDSGGNTPDVDIRIRNLSLGTESGGNLSDFVFENPYVEFAFSGTGASRKLVGVRTGYAKATGIMGNVIDVISGALRPYVKDDTFGLQVGYLPMIGSRNKGYIDGFFEPGLVNTLGKSGPQLWATRTITLANSQDFFMSLQNRKVDYPALSATVGASPTAWPGFWMNIWNGLDARAPLSGGAGPLPDNRL